MQDTIKPPQIIGYAQPWIVSPGESVDIKVLCPFDLSLPQTNNTSFRLPIDDIPIGWSVLSKATVEHMPRRLLKRRSKKSLEESTTMDTTSQPTQGLTRSYPRGRMFPARRTLALKWNYISSRICCRQSNIVRA